MGNIGLYITTVLIWGTTWIAIKYQLGVVSPEVSVAFRFFIASVALFLWAGISGRSLRCQWAQHKWFLALALTMFSTNYVVTYYATETVTTGLIAVIFSTVIMMNLFNERIFLGVAITRKMLAASIVGLVGILLMFSNDIQSLNMETLPGIGWAFFGTYMASVGAITSSKMQNTHKIPVLVSTAYAMLYGSLFTLGFALIQGHVLSFDLSFEYISSLAYLSLGGSAIAFCAYLTLLGRIGPSKAAYTSVLFPVVALGVSYFVEDYRFSAESIVGIALIVVANYMALSRKRVRKPFVSKGPLGPEFDWRKLLRPAAAKDKVS